MARMPRRLPGRQACWSMTSVAAAIARRRCVAGACATPHRASLALRWMSSIAASGPLESVKRASPMLTFRSRMLNLRRWLQPGFLSTEEQAFLNGEGASAKDPVTLAVLFGRRRGNARHRAHYPVLVRAKELF